MGSNTHGGGFMSLSVREHGQRLTIRLERTWGTYGVVVAALALGVYLGRVAYTTSESFRTFFGWNREATLGALLCVLIAFFSWRSEQEVCVLDKERDSVTVERTMPFRTTQRFCLPSLSELDGVSIEDGPDGKTRYKRLALHFESGQTVPVTEA